MLLDKLKYKGKSFELADSQARKDIEILTSSVDQLQEKDYVVYAGSNTSVSTSTIGEVVNYTVSSATVQTTDETGAKVTEIKPDGKTYTVKQGKTKVFDINIAADMVVDSGITLKADGTEKKGSSEKSESAELTQGKIYVRLHIANADTTKDYIYIQASDLGVIYTAGDNITIKDGVISAVNTTYKAGTNVTISGNTISSKDTVTNIYTATSGKGTVPASGILSNVTITGIPAGAKFLCTRCDSPYVIATNGWISNGTFYCTLVNYSNVARETTVECKYYITTVNS